MTTQRFGQMASHKPITFTREDDGTANHHRQSNNHSSILKAPQCSNSVATPGSPGKQWNARTGNEYASEAHRMQRQTTKTRG